MSSFQIASKLLFNVGLSFLFLLAFIGCDHSSGQSASKVTSVYLGEKLIHIEIVSKDRDMKKGLMNRSSLDKDSGMLFVFKTPSTMKFWMKNTRIPLDIGFFDEMGTLREIKKLYPLDLDLKESRDDDIKYALEMNQGWFSSNEIKRGAILELDSLKH
tara:strand:- start:2539 stop:3012 length:474 start_codon:yes stop_codon:yes gene_type:complete